jgi:Fe-S-cluster containining protein
VPRKAEKFNCRTCGLCCVSLYDQEVFCDLTEQDIERLGAHLNHHVVWSDLFTISTSLLRGCDSPAAALATKWRLMRAGPLKDVEACVCVFLRGSILHRTSCRVYARRPQTCRDAVKPGTRLCKDIRCMYEKFNAAS